MFFKQRILQAEYFDSFDRPAAELAEAYSLLRRMNRLFLLSHPFKVWLPLALGHERCRSLSLLDLGAGDGFLGADLTRWAARRGWDWRFTNLDPNLAALQLNPAARSLGGSTLALPFRDQSFDVVLASQMTHHLGSDDDVRQHFREAWRVARQLVFLTDLHRNPAFYAALNLILRLHRCPEHFRTDALISVRRGWRVDEWRAFAEQAGLPAARVWLYAGARIMLLARKNP